MFNAPERKQTQEGETEIGPSPLQAPSPPTSTYNMTSSAYMSIIFHVPESGLGRVLDRRRTWNRILHTQISCLTLILCTNKDALSVFQPTRAAIFPLKTEVWSREWVATLMSVDLKLLCLVSEGGRTHRSAAPRSAGLRFLAFSPSSLLLPVFLSTVFISLLLLFTPPPLKKTSSGQI